MTDISLCRAVADHTPRTEILQPDGSGESAEQCGNTTPGRAPTPVYHDPHPPFETDGRGRVVWSNSGEQARLRSLSSPTIQPQKSSVDEMGVTREKENGVIGDSGHACGNGDGAGQETGVEDATAGVQSSRIRSG